MLLAKLAGAMKASLAGAAATFNALPVQMAQLAEALRAKLEAAEGPAAESPGRRSPSRRKPSRGDPGGRSPSQRSPRRRSRGGRSLTPTYLREEKEPRHGEDE